MSSPFRPVLTIVTATFLDGCGGQAIANDVPVRGTGGSTGAGRDAATQMTTGGTGASTRQDATPSLDPLPGGFPRCGAIDPARANACDGIDEIELLRPNVSSNVDGSIEVWESGPIFVWVHNKDTVTHDRICVGAVVDVQDIEIFDDGDRTNPTRPFPVVPDDTVIVGPGDKRVDQQPPGKVATFTFYPTYEGTNCVGSTISVTASVRPRL